MKNNKFAILSLILSIILIICAVGIPLGIATADDRDIYSYLVTDKLGNEWDAWNSKNNVNFDGDGNKIPTEEYVNIVQDPTDSGYGGVLKIGHAEYDTNISLRVTQATSTQYSHKYETKLYIDGAINDNSYILAKNSDAWGSGAQNRLDIKNMTTKKWVSVTTEDALAGTDGTSGSAFVHVSGGYVTLIFQIDLAAGNYLYMDNLRIAAGNANTYKKNIDTTKGDSVIYTNDFEVPEDNDFQRITKIDEWDVDSTVWAGKVADGNNTEIVLYNNNAVYSGAIVQRVIGLENGTYTLSVDCRSNGHSSAVIAADGFGAAKRQLSIGTQSDEMHKVTLSNLEVTQNYMYVSIWVGGQVGEWVIVDNVTLTKEGSDENFILNGDFESNYSVTVEPVSKGKNPENWGNWLNGMDAQTQFIANEGYKSESSMAATYPVDGASNFNQTVTGLTAGKTYVVSAYVKFKGTGTANLYLKNWGGTYSPSIPKTDVWTKMFTEVTIADGYDRLSLEFFCNAKAGDWLMVDNVRVFEKSNPSVNLIKNGDFETFETNESLPDLVVDYKANIPNWKNWLDSASAGKFDDSVGYLVEDNNTRLAFYNKDKAFRGSINQDIPELENGEYTVSVMVRSSNYNSAVISATNYDKANTSLKKQQSIVVKGDTLSEVSITVPVTNNGMMITVYADGKAGQYVIIDDIKVTAKDSNENLVLNGDFEIKEPVDSTLPQKVADLADGWELWANDDNVADMYVSGDGYNSTTAFAMVNRTAHSTSITQNFDNLADGRYVFSAFVKSSGGQNDATLVAKGWLKDSPKKTTNVKIPVTNVWSRVILEFEVTSGTVSLSLWNDANADNWILIDNAKFYRKDDPKNQLMLNGGFDKYSFYDDIPDLIVDYKATIPNWKNWLGASSEGKFEDSVGYLMEDSNTRLVFFNKTKNFIGSINQDIPVLENGEYTVSVKVRSSDYKSAVVSATEYDKLNPKAKIQKSIVVKGDTLSEVSITVPVTNNAMMITIYADGKAGQYIIVDDVKVTAKDSNEDLVLNGGFEIKEPASSTTPQKMADLAYSWALWANDGNITDMYVSDSGYNSTTAFAMVNRTAHSTSLTQNFNNLSDGRYVFSAFVKSSGGQNDAALVAKGWLKDSPKKTTNVKIPVTNVWSRVILEFEVTSGTVSLSLWNDANAGNWVMIDNAKFYRKDDPKTQLMLNGGFDDYASYAADFKLPPRAVGSANATKPYIDSYTNKDNQTNSNKRPSILSPYTGETFGVGSGLVLIALIGVFTLILLVKKNLKKI